MPDRVREAGGGAPATSVPHQTGGRSLVDDPARATSGSDVGAQPERQQESAEPLAGGPGAVARAVVGAVVVGAGHGRRLGGVEKAFLAVAGQPLVAYSLEVLEASALVDRVCLVVSSASVPRARDLVRERGWRKVVAVVGGGAERQDSVRAGLEAIGECDYVLVHDAARPLLTERLIDDGLAAATRWGAALAATPLRDTLKRVAGDAAGGRVVETVDRSGLWAAQTPQVFRTQLLRAAYDAVGPAAGAFTDDAALVAAAGYPVYVYPGDAANVKVTLPEDVPIVEALLRRRREGE
jgi:2-C-methyl-D-erythritol 4-phosphate cytidylyltransferase